MNEQSNLGARSWRLMLAIGVLSLVAACGGGGGSSERELTTACPAQAVSWQVGAAVCLGGQSLPQSKPLTRLQASDGQGTYGDAYFRCEAGRWVQEAGATCQILASGQRQLRMDAQVNPGGRVYDYFSNAFAEIGAARNGDPTLDGFFSASVWRSSGVYALSPGTGDFIHRAGLNWSNFVNVRFDVSGYSGSGDYEADIVALTALDLKSYVDRRAFVLNAAYATSLAPSSAGTYGKVILRNDEVIAVEINARVSTLFSSVPVPGGSLTFTGDLLIERDGAMSLGVGVPLATSCAGTGNCFQARWEYTGTMSFTEITTP
ncbi:MAG: hypothetical protein ACOZE7_08330 [Pseudomonadota bacterium]